MKQVMTSRERVGAAVAHTEPDRVPIDYSANGGIDLRLKEHFGLDPSDSEGLLNALNVDFRNVGPQYTGPRLHAGKPGVNVDAVWGIETRWIKHDSGGYADYCGFPLKDASAEVLATWPMPSPDDFDYASLPELCEHHGDKWIVLGGAGLCDVINNTGMIRTMEQTLVDLAVQDEAALAYIDRRLDIQFECHRRALEAAAGRIDMLYMGEDLGTQIGPMISKPLYRRVLRPRHQRFIDLAHAYGIPVMFHSCGSSRWVFEDLIEMGVNVIDTLQPEATGMEPASLKSTFGDRLAFHGCISTGGPVAYGTVQDTIDSCRGILDIMMPGGGYCFAPTHALQDNSPTENVVAMYEAALRYGVYQQT